MAEADAQRLYAQAHGEALRPLLDGAALDRAMSGEPDFGVDRL